MPIYGKPTNRELMIDLVCNGDRHATDGVLPIRAAYEFTPAGKVVRIDGRPIR